MKKPDVILATPIWAITTTEIMVPNAPGDVEMARSLAGRIAGDDRRRSFAGSGLYGLGE